MLLNMDRTNFQFRNFSKRVGQCRVFTHEMHYFDSTSCSGIHNFHNCQTKLLFRNKLITGRDTDRILASTVHSFQGDEKDIIITDRGEVALRALYNLNSVLLEMTAYAEAQSTSPYKTKIENAHWEDLYKVYAGLSDALRMSIDTATDGKLKSHVPNDVFVHSPVDV